MLVVAGPAVFHRAVAAEHLLVEKLDDLARITLDPDPRGVLRASAILRQLFLDGGKSLVVQANRVRQRKLVFETTQLTPGSRDWYAHDDLDPHHPSHQLPACTLNEQNFLAQQVATLSGTQISVRQVVRCAANVAGGVHLGTPDAVEAKILAAEAVAPGSVLAASLRPIARVVLRGLSPLRYAIEDLDRFAEAAGFSLMMKIGIDRLDLNGDLQLCSFGKRTRLRFLVDRDYLLRAIVTDGSDEFLVTSGHVPRDREFWFRFEFGTCGEDVLSRIVIDGVELLRLFSGKGGPQWDIWAEDNRAASIGHSSYGTFLAAEILSFSAMLGAGPAEQLRGWSMEEDQKSAAHGGGRVVFAPGKGMDLSSPTDTHVVDSEPASRK